MSEAVRESRLTALGSAGEFPCGCLFSRFKNPRQSRGLPTCVIDQGTIKDESTLNQTAQQR